MYTQELNNNEEGGTFMELNYATNGKAAGTYTYTDAAWLKTE